MNNDFFADPDNLGKNLRKFITMQETDLSNEISSYCQSSILSHN